MTDLFRDVAADVAERFGFAYPWRDDARVTAHLRRVHAAVGGANPTGADASTPRDSTA